MVTDEQLNEIDALAEKATPGPWSTGFLERHIYCGQAIDTYEVAGKDMCWIAKVQEHRSCAQTGTGNPNGRFIAASRTAVPRLIAEVRRLRALIKQAQHCKECNARWDNFELRGDPLPGTCDCWKAGS